METREHLKIIIGSRSPSGLPSIVEVPSMPERADLPPQELDSQPISPQSHPRTELEAARGELQALDQLLELEEAKLIELQGSSLEMYRNSQSTDFIKLARQEVESEYQRLSNYYKRKQNMSNSRSNTGDSGIADMSYAGSPAISPAPTLRLASPPSPRTVRENPMLSRRRSSSFRSREVPSSPVAGQSVRNVNMASQLASQSQTSPNVQPRADLATKSGSFDSLSKTKERYLEQFEQELAEIDQGDQLPPTLLGDPAIPIFPDPTAAELDNTVELDAAGRTDIDYGISKTRNSLQGLLNRSLPPSPALFQQSQLSPSGTLQSSMASSPPNLGSGLMKHRSSFAQSAPRNSTDREPWEWLARDVSVIGIQYSCRHCSLACPTAMQFKYGSTGSLRLRIICASSDGVLFNQELSSSKISLPHVFNSRADPKAATSVVLEGTNKRLDYSSRGAVRPIQLTTQPQYQFESIKDSETFQQLVFRMKLVRKFDIRGVSSSVDSGTSYSETLRIFQDANSPEKLVLVTHGALVKGLEPFIFWEPRSAFASSDKSGESKLKLKLAEPKTLSRRHSKDSGISGMSWSSMESQSSSASSSSQRMKWLEIDFQSSEERTEFLAIWTG